LFSAEPAHSEQQHPPLTILIALIITVTVTVTVTITHPQ
jgi:hypothetical protein